MDTPTSVPISSPVTASTSPSSSSTVPPRSPQSSSVDIDLNRPILVLTDGNGLTYTTTISSTQNPSSTISPSTPNSNPAIVQQEPQAAPNIGAIIAGVGGGVGFLLLSVGVTWFIRTRGVRRRAGHSLIKDRKFYPDKYNQTVTSNRHGQFNEVDPGPMLVKPPPRPPPPPLLHYTSSSSSDPLSRQTSSYQGYTPSPRARGNWAGIPPTDGLLEDIPPLTRHRVPYPNSPQPLIDRYTMLPSRSIPSPNTTTPPLWFPPDPPPQYPHHLRSSSPTHRRHHSHHSYHNRLHRQGHDAEHDSYFSQLPIPNPSPSTPVRVTRRNTIFVSPPMSPSSFSVLSSPPRDFPATRAEPSTVTPTNRPSVARSAFSSTDSLVSENDVTTTKRMMCTNPDLDIDLETDTEPDSFSGSGGSPSATDIIRLYTRDRDTSPTGSTLKDKDSPTMATVPISTSAESS
ncbi:hypothetical protein BDM02DRAFT_3270817 [Thelephora ganbajun]|uniref:Uncharacterized protein n=1 Tax=Thelephora ganbajun TaxID=370292 RepID=A0ACB6ZAD7_THEGA|nr:hypothetical protein BDM02DRAFT_3270817 [Thelephora ganbajun]